MIDLNHFADFLATKKSSEDKIPPPPPVNGNGPTFEKLFRRRRSPVTPLLPAPVSPNTILTWLDVVDEALCDLAIEACSDVRNQAHMLIQAILSEHVPVAELLNSAVVPCIIVPY